ncbi:DUF1801 domain-containing protein [Candidatus Roizmanbacteria bacterium]|nr:DUF1801 domain-containing protein [Candidatus Roizmanbacteria bacterium]
MKKAKVIVTSDWRAKTILRIRTLIQQADPEVIEERKYKMPSNPAGIPVWYLDGMICTGETYQKHLRLTFAKGPALKEHDPKGLFNRHSAMVIQEDDKIDETAFKKLIRAAVKLNQEGKSKSKK